MTTETTTPMTTHLSVDLCPHHGHAMFAEEMIARKRAAYQPVPARFGPAAREAINNGGYPRADSTLLVWAAKKRTKERRRRKLAKAAKRRNRA